MCDSCSWSWIMAEAEADYSARLWHELFGVKTWALDEYSSSRRLLTCLPMRKQNDNGGMAR